MKKQTRFAKMVRLNRKSLIKEHGFLPSTLSMWASGERIPKWDNATKLSSILDIPIEELPYYKVEINK